MQSLEAAALCRWCSRRLERALSTPPLEGSSGPGELLETRIGTKSSLWDTSSCKPSWTLLWVNLVRSGLLIRGRVFSHGEKPTLSPQRISEPVRHL